jgi:endoglucanase
MMNKPPRQNAAILQAFIAVLSVAAALECSAQAADAAATPGIRINQLGFLPDISKLALVESTTARSFTVVRADNGKVMLKGNLQQRSGR